MTLIDGSALAMRLGEITVDSSTHGSVQLDTAPSQTSTPGRI